MAFVNEYDYILLIFWLLFIYIIMPIKIWIQTHDIFASLIPPILLTIMLICAFVYYHFKENRN